MSSLQEAYDRLFAAYGPQHWWPGQTPLEIAVGAILTQNTNWRNVEKALANLNDNDLMTVHDLVRLDEEELAELIRPAGYYRVKARRLKNFLTVIVEQFECSIERLLELDRFDLREELLRISGIGPETADSIVLYASEQPVFVIDTYTARVVKRHGWIAFDADYHEMQERFHYELVEDVPLYNEFHALIVRVGKEHCKPKPKCDGCPLACMLPESGPLDETW